VEAAAAVVDTESGTSSNLITERQIQDAPLVNRSVLDLAMTLPNVSGDAGTEAPSISAVTTCPGCNLAIGGGRPMSTMIMADGTNNTGVSLARTIVSFSPETVQEFTVQTSAFSAEYGTTGGGIINATTKSGSNSFNGTAVWYNRNPNFQAAPFSLATTNRPVAKLKYNQISLSAGGPVYIPKVYNGKNRTFWFAAFEPNYRRDRLDQYGLLPTDAMRQGNFSGLVNTASGWLPQSVVDQFKSIAPNAVAPAGGGDNNIYNQYNVVSGNQFQPITPGVGPGLRALCRQRHPASHTGRHRAEGAALHRQSRPLLPEQQWPDFEHLRPASAEPGREAVHAAHRRNHQQQEPALWPLLRYPHREDSGDTGQPHQQWVSV
jgi:hypothetical protein